MTREEARKLLSGYATGSLTELERQLLFDAALDDQELFDELAEEQVLKEIIDLPGAKDRLISALTPAPEPQRQLVWWPWAVGATAVATLTIAVLIAYRPAGNQTPSEVALNLKQPASEPQLTQVETAGAKAKEELRNQEAKLNVDRFTLPAAAPPPAAQPAQKALDEEASVTAQAQPEPARPAPPPPAAKSAARADNVTPTETAALRDKLATAAPKLPILAPPAAQARGTVAISALSSNLTTSGAPSATSVASGEALTYEVRATGILRVTPARPGFLAVTYDGRPLFPTSPVVPGTPVDISIPLEAQQLRIDFAVSATAPAPAAVQSQESTGTLTLPTGPNPRAVILIPAQR